MWASFFLFFSDLHHWTSSGQPLITSSCRHVSCRMLFGRVLMPLQLRTSSSIREVRSPNLSGSATVPFLQSSTIRVSREEIHWSKFVEPHVRSLQLLISKSWRPGRWRSKLHWCRGASQLATESHLFAAEEEAPTSPLLSHGDNSAWSLLHMITCLPGGENAMNLKKGLWFILSSKSFGKASTFEPSSTLGMVCSTLQGNPYWTG